MADNAGLGHLCEALGATITAQRERPAARSAASLDSVTQLGRRCREPVSVTVWPECGEATIVYLGGESGREIADPDVASSLGLTQLADQFREQQRKASSERVRVSRARGRIRRYVVRNRLTRMWTLTFAPPQPQDRAVALAAMQDFARRLQQYWLDRFGERCPYLYVFERHKSGAWHVHMLTQSRRLDHAVMQRLWGNGWVQYSDGPKRHGRSQREVARSCARYASKYVGKDIGDGLPANVHAYEPAQGFQPERVARSVPSMVTGLEAAVRSFGGEAPSWESSSADWSDWEGPPVKLLRWDA